MAKAKIHRDAKSGFLQFSRNGRWGTCGDCPRDSNGIVYPEFCKFTDRYDHNLKLAELVKFHEEHLADMSE